LWQKKLWIRLPSFLGKFGKTLTNFVQTVKIGKSYTEKAAIMLWSQWLGYGNMDTNWFYIAFGKKLKNLVLKYITELPGKDTAVPLEFWQIKSDTTCEVTDNEWNAFMHSRYGLRPRDLEILLEQLDDCPFPAVLTNDAVTVMVRRDYA